MGGNIDLNEKLIGMAMKLSRTRSKRQVIKWALAHYIKYFKRLRMLSLFGKVEWEGDLMELRKTRI